MPATAQILPNEKELFALMASGDEAAFTQIFYHYTQRMYAYILTKTKSEDAAEEIVQEVFMKLWAKKETLAHVENHESYIFRMVANKIVDWFRNMSSEKNAIKTVWKSIEHFTNNTSETLDLHQSQELINEAVAHLSPQRKKIFLMSRQEGMTRSQIAEQLNLSVNTVNNHLNEAVRNVKEYLMNIPGASLPLLFMLLRIY
ncbi:MAG: RNA polymerase sigma-70 factor [Chitinophagaceae bacterium]